MRRSAPVALLILCFSLLLISPTLRDADAQKLAAVNASASVNTYSTLEQEVLNEINLARTRPSEYAAFLEQLRPQFTGKEYRRPGKPVLLTEEGAPALEEAIKFLRGAKPIPAVTLSQGMCAGARALVKEQSATGATGHRGADGSFCEQRTQLFGTWAAPIGENLNYSDDTARERVITLLIDDGVANRGHRQRIMNASYKVVGVACGGHKIGGMCVITFAGGFTDKSAPAQATKKNANAPTPPAGAKRF
ncbi:MAG TPA: CAP domain-containing protein [Pyrinomonadaceae bacterium]|nr:CAP domain-containing protein [Pyrinomonadaceae bacterium]